MNERDQLLHYLLENAGIEAQPPQAIERIGGPGPFAHSFAQERFWFLDQFERAWPVYNSCKVERLVGDLRVDWLEASLNMVIARHEVLRTNYPAADGQPVQQIAPVATVTLAVSDLAALPSAEQDKQIESLIRQECQRPFDLSAEPVFRVKLLRLKDAEHLLLFTLHQIVFDSRSVAIFFAELWAAYRAKCSGNTAQLVNLPIQYRDFAAWQRQRIQGETLQRLLNYWREQLAGDLPVLSLPTDRPRPALQSFNGARRRIQIAPPLLAKLNELSRSSGATLFMTLLAAFKTLLHRYTSAEDLIVGCPVLNRQQAEVENLIGSFVNTLALRTDFSGNPSFREALRRVRAVCLNGYEHQELPFEKLIEELRPERDLSRSALFQVMFAFQNDPAPDLQLEQIRSENVEIDGGSAKFELTLSLAEKARGLTGYIEYNTELFERGRIERMAGHFQTLLQAIVADPDQSIAALPILTEAERRQLLVAWNDTAADYPKDKRIDQLFEEQVARTPDAVALEFDKTRITYRELNRRANRLAHHLISLGAGPEKLVGICLERSIEMVAALLAILKTGAAYVPFDPSYPNERLRFMLDDAKVALLITQQKLFDGSDPSTKVICLDGDAPVIQRRSTKNPRRQVNADNSAYVIYTSGSTGRPKGVVVEHRAVVNCLTSIGKLIELSPRDSWLAVTTISFDIAAIELFLPLIAGAKVVLADRDECLDVARLVERIERSRPTVMQATPSLWRMLLDSGWENQREFKMLCGGEVLSRQLADRLLPHGDSLWNLYGPTETTIWSTLAKVAKDWPITIGRPIENTQVYILDAHMQLMPIGIPGDLYIGGDGVARGYLNRPELTAEKFIANPLNENPNARLYRTGDRARYRADGVIEFLGRDDNQVKIRGQRIELGEIEAILNRHPAVKECVIVAASLPPPRRRRTEVGATLAANNLHEEAPPSQPSPVQGEGVSDWDPELIAYIVAGSEQPRTTELQRFLRESLPDSMIPTQLVFLQSLPLTASGKLDRHALPAPDGERPQLDGGFVEPRTEIEELIAQVWREMLRIEKIGVHDNFFGLGGHSLLATRVVARLRNDFHVDLALRKLFELPTIAALARHIELLRQFDCGTTTTPILPADRSQPLPLSFAQRRLWYLQKVDTQLSAYNIPAAFRVTGDLDRNALEQALNQLTNRHEVLRSSVKEIGGQPLQEYLPSLTIALPLIDLTHLPKPDAETEARQIANSDAYELYDLSHAPLMRASLAKLADDDHLLIVNFHHLIADGASLAIFYRELAALYDAARNQKSAALPTLPVQYGDYAAWQERWLKSPAFASELSYWRHQLAGLPKPCALPADFHRPLAPSYQANRVAKTLSKELTAALRDLSQRQNVTLFMTLFAAFNVLLSRLSGENDLVIGAAIAGRNHPETEGLIGFFINALPLRSDLSGDPSFTALLQRVRQVCLNAYSHQDVPFEKIVEALRPPRAPGGNPIFDILFNVADVSERLPTLAGCAVTKFAAAEPSAKFDLVISAPEMNGKLELAMVYNKVLFRERRITLLLEQFAHLLGQVADHPESPIGALSLVNDATRGLLPDPEAPLDDSWRGAIQDFLAAQAERAPAKLAVVDAEQSWTYAQLNCCANRLAHRLVAAGIKRHDVVAIYSQRSAPLVLALFATLKAGAAFLILDPAYPAARTVEYLRIAQPKGWLQLEAAGDLPEELVHDLDHLDLRCRIVVPQSQQEILSSLSAFPDNEPAAKVSADDPAYIAFTSGSTGEPKGVICRHGPVTHFLPWQKDAFHLTGADRFALLSGLAYSHLHRDVFTAMFLGATLHIPAPAAAREPRRLADWLARQAITVLHLTPALGQLLLSSHEARLPAVRRIFFGGDVLTAEDVAAIRRLAPNATIGSFYGATETQRAVGYYEIPDNMEAEELAAWKTIPLGRGIAGVQLLVLTASRRLAGIGELGEIFVRSPHLAAGYIDDNDRTERMFIVNPFTADPRDRIYRTGELGRYRADGNIEWAGRNDRRVNLRGFRVELEEIENALKRHPAVKAAAVIVHASDANYPKSGASLVAYIAADEEAPSLADPLRSYLAARLPPYMVPAHFVVLPTLPLSPSGKIDYRSLPTMRNAARAGATTAARNEVEKKLCEILADLLGRSEIGVDDNFFRVGGHSLLAARAAARIGDTFGVELDLAVFLARPTVIDLAEHVNQLRASHRADAPTGNHQREEFDL